jgi:energy-coupling factor transporter ATP-binding protein EcfA2
MILLEVMALSKEFDGLRALDAVSFSAEGGKILGIIGPNGAGKTTLFNLMSGLYSPTSGEINFQGKSILRLKPHQISRLGIGRPFQIVRPSQSGCGDNVWWPWPPLLSFSFESSDPFKQPEILEEVRRFIDRPDFVLTQNSSLSLPLGIKKRRDCSCLTRAHSFFSMNPRLVCVLKNQPS